MARVALPPLCAALTLSYQVPVKVPAFCWVRTQSVATGIVVPPVPPVVPVPDPPVVPVPPVVLAATDSNASTQTQAADDAGPIVPVTSTFKVWLASARPSIE